ncbi:YqxA family protein [Parageobacillus thermoglucosidasius]|uniref:YqxA family protein n=1 Tax=Parageobacillus thermoglucosidasius TaxID=1426 RepID=A0AB38R4U2_PARTM|nr:YqxA family protein [Parageobacillus thermoglucosidasius]UOE78203.1 YqxA family protein [Parageobacillus thermoglucosidasius]GCD81782.1 hypothetical protein PTHTG4_08440 [Parageobacillus thermoglucosidasius]
MLKFTIQFLLAVMILFFGVLLGMQQANEGLRKMKGFDDPAFPSVFHISKDQNGEVEASVFGNKVMVEDVQEKHEKIETMKTFNLFSELGKQFAEAVQSLMEKLLFFLEKWLGK